MKPEKQLKVVAGLLFGIASISSATAADNCTGYDNLVSTYFEERDLGQGMKLQIFAQESILTSDHAAYHLATGQCTGSALMTPDGKVRAMGYCARRDKDGDTQSIDWHIAPDPVYFLFTFGGFFWCSKDIWTHIFYHVCGL